jgi:NitT/TauT family transport system substrate-binding protein
MSPAFMHRGRVLAAVVSAGLLLSATGCGSEAGEAQESGLASITLATSITGSSFLGVTAGVERGIFEKHGIDLEIVKVKNTSEGAAALESGQADISSVLTEGVISLAAAGSDTKIVANMLTEDQHILYGGEGIDSLEDLRGGKVGVVGPGSGTEILAKHLFEVEGIGEENAEYVPSGAASSQVAALISGQIDAAGLVPPYDHTAEGEGLNKILEYRDVIPGLTPQVFAVKEASIQDNTEALENFLAAYTESTQWLVENEEEAVAILQKDTNTDEETARASYMFAKPDYSLDGHVDPAGLEQWLELGSQYGNQKRTLTVDDIYTDELLGDPR